MSAWNRRLRRVWHTPLPSWKGESVAFVWLQLEGGLTKRIVVKAARYEAEVFPASINASVKPGLPEMWVYGRATPVMGAFIPDVYLAHEEEPGRHYVYVLEDLTGGYGKKRGGPLGWRDGINGLFRVQEALALAVDEYGAGHLLVYDDAYSEALVSYAKRALAAYDGGSDGSVRERLLQTWPLLEETYLGDRFDLLDGGMPIHGDFDTRNVFIHRKDRHQVKVVDWEWAGFGWPHGDLASYLK